MKLFYHFSVRVVDATQGDLKLRFTKYNVNDELDVHAQLVHVQMDPMNDDDLFTTICKWS